MSSAAAWGHIKEDLTGQASKQKITGLDSLEVAQQALETLDAVILRSDTPLTAAHASLLVPSVAERLGDSKQPVRAQALRLLVSLFKAAKPEVILEKLGPLWQHKSWRVKHGLLEVLAEVVSTTGPSALGGRDQNNAVLKQVVRLMEDADLNVREAAVGCLKEAYRQAPAAVVSSVQASSMRPGQQYELFMRIGMQVAAAEAAAPDTGVKRASSNGTDVGSTGTSAHHAPSDVHADGGRAGGGGKNGGAASAFHDAPPSKAADARRQSAATAGPAPPASSGPAAKRGGFKDGGGVTADGEMPVVAPIAVASDRELRAELEAAIAALAQAPNADWTARMTAMQRVEGLVLGGALEWDAFHELIKSLSQALSQQFKERRSSIARQACHLIGVLARAMGPRFEPHALGLLPTLFGVLVITVAVMAESADVGVRELLRACQTGRLLQVVSDAACKEKNPKTRHYALSYLILVRAAVGKGVLPVQHGPRPALPLPEPRHLSWVVAPEPPSPLARLPQILEDWDVGVWTRNVEAVEAAIRAAAQDSTGEARLAGRTAMALYHSAAPDRANAFLRRLDGGLHEKLAGSVAGAKTAKPASAASRQSISAAIAAKLQLARQAAADSDAGILVMVPASSKPERRPEPQQQPRAEPASSSASRHAAAGDAASAPRPRPAASRASGASAAPAPHTATVSIEPLAESTRSLAARTSRKSMGLPPGRIPGGSVDLGSLLGESSSSSLNDHGAQARAAALRRPRMSALPHDLPQRIPAGPPATPAVRLPVETGAASRVPCAQTPETNPSRPPLVPGQPGEGQVLLAEGLSMRHSC
ncbi:CLIP-associating protein 1 [Tetrabaena socialis]|uniref:CLIP-associating protein 1 n=1 Tax=Tetrabaena socialis TaxID=47790 RepID=A0A2J8AGI7_9CHLO|nr:CLIP-associating protein 1 [Tetrabaena socialis]|eukprot:PNH11648.1 CLIP-associating protein 1 [Tetrabaena socialis]